MALSRRRETSNIWPGFVDAVTTLLMVLTFVLTIFTVMQSVLRETITAQGSELTELNRQLAALADALGLQRARADDLQSQNSLLSAGLASRTEELALAQTQIAGLQADITAREAERQQGLAAMADLRAELSQADDRVLALGLDLESQRQRAEETLTLLAAAQAETASAAAQAAEAMDEAERQAALLQIAQQKLTKEQQIGLEGAQRLVLLNQQMAALRQQVASLQELLDASAAKDAASDVQLDALGSQLNMALAQLAAEQKRRAELEQAERQRLEAENQNLEAFRSEFFGQMRSVLDGQEGLRIVGDRFVFSSEVLFAPGSADLSAEGSAQIGKVAATLSAVMDKIPPQIDWIIRVDGHTDNLPLSGTGEFADNWELSQARALAVVRYMASQLGFPPDRLVAAGFGEHRPVALGTSPQDLAQNRRIELKLTER